MPRLEEKLRTFNEAAAERMPDHVLQALEDHTRKLEEERRAESAVGEGDEAPDFELDSTAGGTVTLSGLVHRGPVILSFYRGRW